MLEFERVDAEAVPVVDRLDGRLWEGSTVQKAAVSLCVGLSSTVLQCRRTLPGDFLLCRGHREGERLVCVTSADKPKP